MTVAELTDAWLDHLEHFEADRIFVETPESDPDRVIPDPVFLRSPENRRWVEELVSAFRERISTLVDLTENARPFLSTEIEYDPKAVRKILKPSAREPLRRVLEWIRSHNELPSREEIHDYLGNLAESMELKLG